jgi:hypothetical protein
VYNNQPMSITGQDQDKDALESYWRANAWCEGNFFEGKRGATDKVVTHEKLFSGVKPEKITMKAAFKKEGAEARIANPVLWTAENGVHAKASKPPDME